MWYLSPSRGLAVCVTVIVTLAILRRHVYVMVHTVATSQLWSSLSQDCFISFERDGFDVTFARYPKMQPASRLLSSSSNQSAAAVDEPYPADRVPAILHYISFVPEEELPLVWHNARRSCLDLHPTTNGYRHVIWKEQDAHFFLQEHYPAFVAGWLSYEFQRQRMDSFKYFLLHYYGGIVIDNNVYCQRSFGPLRQFPVVHAVEPEGGIGLARGLMMAEPRHPFYEQVIQALSHHHLHWYSRPRHDIDMTTGMKFLSSQHLRFPLFARRQSLRLIPDSTPLFRKIPLKHGHHDLHHVHRRIGHRSLWSMFPNPLSFILLVGGVLVIVYVVLTACLDMDWCRQPIQFMYRKRRRQRHPGFATDDTGAIWIRIAGAPDMCRDEELPEYSE